MDYQRLLDLTEQILILRGGPTSGNWAHDGRPGRKGGSGRGGGFKRLKLAKGTTSRPDVVGISRRVRKKRKQLKDKGVLPTGRGRDTKKGKRGTKKDIGRLAVAKSTIAKAKAKRDKNLGEIRDLENGLNAAARKKDKEMKKRPKTTKAFETRKANIEKLDKEIEGLEKKLGGRTSTNIINNFNNETKTASDELFEDNLKKAKGVRKELKDKAAGVSKRLESSEKDLANAEKDLDVSYEKFNKIGREKGWSHPDAKKAEKVNIENIAKIQNARDRVTSAKDDIRKELLSVLKVDDPSTLSMSSDTTKKKTDREKWGSILEDVNSAVSSDVTIPNHEIKIEKRKVRANASWGGNQITVADYNGVNVIAHEIGHTIEMKNPRVLQRAIEWRDNRTKGESYVTMNEAEGRANTRGGYSSSEITKPDKFFHPYVGKSYGRATEVISMGVGEMISDPVSLMEKDSDMFDFMYAVLRS